jgi:hypothetical protein
VKGARANVSAKTEAPAHQTVDGVTALQAGP